MQLGDRFERTVRWTRDDIKAFATLVGDSNPLHHDDGAANASRFGGLIASGAQTVAFLMALCASQTSAGRSGVGLQFDYRLLRAAYPDADIVLRWEVVSVAESERPTGTIVELRGEAVQGGQAILSAFARTLLFKTSF